LLDISFILITAVRAIICDMFRAYYPLFIESQIAAGINKKDHARPVRRTIALIKSCVCKAHKAESPKCATNINLGFQSPLPYFWAMECDCKNHPESV